MVSWSWKQKFSSFERDKPQVAESTRLSHLSFQQQHHEDTQDDELAYHQVVVYLSLQSDVSSPRPNHDDPDDGYSNGHFSRRSLATTQRRLDGR